MVKKLPAPRLQLTWRKATEAEIEATPSMRSIVGQHEPVWACDYALVMPLRDTDIRREDENGKKVRKELVLPINTALRGSVKPPCDFEATDTPYRDGSHAKWDAAVLGGLPIYVVSMDGTAARLTYTVEK